MASSSNNPDVKHDVFLSFRGEETRNNFTSHLDAALRRKKIQTFIDDELERGEEISPSLLEAIERSRISVVVLSENYASSRWCLEELAKILDCKKRFGQMVIPIFYHVDPSHVRNQTGAFGKAFNALKKRFEERLDVLQRFIFWLCPLFYPKKENDVLQRWETALMEVGNLSGYTTDSKKHESKLIEETVADILDNLDKISPSDHNDLIGVESAIKKIESLLEIGSNDVCIVGIWGIGGIGKTSISRAIFNKHRRYFEGSYFGENVREESERRGLTFLREQLLCTILGDGFSNIGHTFRKEILGRKKVLIVFDDVTSLNQIENLTEDPKCLGLGSRIIVTSRDKQVLNNFCGANKIYKLEGIHHPDALQLFNRYAFRHNGYTINMELSERMVTYAKGVPLALKVLGSSLLGKTKQEWKDALNKLERSPPKDIQDVLKISFDGLDYKEKEIFLDIACFFKGGDRDLIIDVMDSCGYFAKFGLSVLIDKSLIIVSNNVITMHDLLEEMGKEIVRKESDEYPGKRSRLFHSEDISHILTRKKGTKKIKSICLDVSRVGEISLTPDAFSKMQNLKYLKVYSSHDGEDFNKLYGFQDVEFEFPELKYLSWHRYPWTSLPSKFHPENLIALEMPESNIEQLWPEDQNIGNLKRIDLSNSKHLLKCPNLSSAKNLETLNLENCTSLIKIHSSIQCLNKLSTLNLRGCSNLDTMPSISCNVEKLYLDGSAIRELPSSIGNLSKLATLDLHGCTRLESLPSSIGELKSLENLFLFGCLKLNSLPDEIGNLEALRTLRAGDTGIREVPPSIGCLNNLFKLDFQGCKFQELPSSIGSLSKLKILVLNGCTRLESLPSNICKLKSLKFLYLSGCLKLNSLPDEIGNLEDLFQLHARDTGIREVPSSIVCLNNPYELDFQGCKVLEHGGWISGLQCLKCLNLSNCGITELPSSLGQLTSLARLCIGRNKFESIPASIINLSNLFYLDLCYCDVLKSLPELPSNIGEMDAHNCKSLELLSGLSSTDFNNWHLYKANFINCLKLDQSAIEDMVKTTLQNSRRRGIRLSNHICVPGSSIPEWFTFRSKGSSIELPPGCSNYDPVGFSLCVVISPRDDHNKSKELTLHYDEYCKADGAQYEKWCGPILYYSTHPLPPFIDSDHIVFGYMRTTCPIFGYRGADFSSGVLYQFYFRDEEYELAEGYEVKECGILLDPPLVGPPHAKRQKLA